MSNSLWLHGLQHTRLPYPSLSPGVCSDSCALSQTRERGSCWSFFLHVPIGSSSLPISLATCLGYKILQGTHHCVILWVLWSLNSLSFFKFCFIFKLYKTALVLPNIKMNLPQVYMCAPSWTLLPPHTIPLGRPSALAPSIQYRA